MFDYKKEKFIYSDALDLKHPETTPIATEHHAKQTNINMTFDTVEDVAGFTSAVFKGDKEKVYIIKPNFMLPRKGEDLFNDYSANCIIM